jgi:hypothetical protein
MTATGRTATTACPITTITTAAPIPIGTTDDNMQYHEHVASIRARRALFSEPLFSSVARRDASRSACAHRRAFVRVHCDASGSSRRSMSCCFGDKLTPPCLVCGFRHA